jgi:hypothetical protein
MSQQRVEAAEWLTRYLAQHGPQSHAVVELNAAARGIGAAELELALDDMNVETVLRLPDEVRVLVNGKR